MKKLIERWKQESDQMIEQEETKKSADFEIYKTDDDKHLVFGWASVVVTVDGEELVDRQQDMIDPEDLEEAAYEYVLNFRDTGEEHIENLRKKGRLVESCVFTKEKQAAIGIPAGILPVGWWIGFKIDDPDTWQRVKNGTYRMFSIEGKAQREEIQKSAYDEWLEENMDKFSSDEEEREFAQWKSDNGFRAITASDVDEIDMQWDEYQRAKAQKKTPVAKSFDEVLKYNHNHDALGRFSSGSGGPKLAPDGAGGGRSGSKFSAKDSAKKINDISMDMNNGGEVGKRWKEVRDILQSAPKGTVLTETGSRGAKFQYEKTGADEWTDSTDGHKSDSKLLSMSWAGITGLKPSVSFSTKDTAPTRQEIEDSQTAAVNGQLDQWIAGGEARRLGKSANIDELEEVQKFNPYHGYHGYFSTANAASSMTFRTNSAAGQKAIDKIKAKQQAWDDFYENTIVWASDTPTLMTKDGKYVVARNNGIKEKAEEAGWKEVKERPSKEKPKQTESKAPETYGNTEKQTEHPSDTESTIYDLTDYLENNDERYDMLDDPEERDEALDSKVNEIMGTVLSWSGDSHKIRQASRGETVEGYAGDDYYKQEAENLETFIKASPKWAGGTIYRGLKPAAATKQNILSNAAAGKTIDLRGLSSWSSDKYTAEKFSYMEPGSVVLVSNNKSTNYGTSIKHLSDFNTEDEVLMSSKAIFTPTKMEKILDVVYIYGDLT